jgi:glutamyl-Q tRNA(Asp) synthetase
MSRPVFRFAPSPNGLLHLGHAYSALLNFELARLSGGRFLLRIEDIDRTRCRPEFEAAILRDLEWLGLEWETPVRRQSRHFDAYREALARLEEADLVYPSFMSRAAIARAAAGRDLPRDPDGSPLYPGDDRDLPAEERDRLMRQGRPFAWRLDMARATARSGALAFGEIDGDGTAAVTADPGVWGDVILARRDAPTSYHLSVVIDDALQGVTHVVRGRDLYAATGVHRLLQQLLGLPAPVYCHHRLITDRTGRKLSKSAADSGIAALREAGATPADIRRMVGLEPDLRRLAGAFPAPTR